MAAMPRERIDRERRLVPSSTIFLKVKSRLRALLEVRSLPAAGRPRQRGKSPRFCRDDREIQRRNWVTLEGARIGWPSLE
jgi:hypothetical protein